MNVKQLMACVGLITGGVLGFGAMPAHAIFAFDNYCADGTEFGSQEACLEQAPFKDIILQSVKYGDMETPRSDLTLVNKAVIVGNEVWEGGNTGAASADRGTQATLGVVKEDVEAEDIANDDPNRQSALTNRNLNSIVDTEDDGRFAIDLFFQRAVDNVLIWERGMNSALRVQAITQELNGDGQHRVVGSEVKIGNFGKEKADGSFTRTLIDGFTPWEEAGFEISTTEIAGASKAHKRDQYVGSLGISKLDFGLLNDEKIIGIRLISEEDYNGADWKVLGTVDPTYEGPEDVPEPFALAGLALVGGAIVTRRRQA